MLAPADENSYKGVYDDMYFLKSGTLTVDWDGHNFTLDAITYYGTHITLTGLTTGVDETKVGTSMFVYAENGSLSVENAQGSFVTVFNILGEKLAEVKVENGQATISGLDKNAVYVVKSGSEIQKIGL